MKHLESLEKLNSDTSQLISDCDESNNSFLKLSDSKEHPRSFVDNIDSTVAIDDIIKLKHVESWLYWREIIEFQACQCIRQIVQVSEKGAAYTLKPFHNLVEILKKLLKESNCSHLTNWASSVFEVLSTEMEACLTEHLKNVVSNYYVDFVVRGKRGGDDVLSLSNSEIDNALGLMNDAHQLFVLSDQLDTAGKTSTNYVTADHRSSSEKPLSIILPTDHPVFKVFFHPLESRFLYHFRRSNDGQGGGGSSLSLHTPPTKLTCDVSKPEWFLQSTLLWVKRLAVYFESVFRVKLSDGLGNHETSLDLTHQVFYTIVANLTRLCSENVSITLKNITSDHAESTSGVSTNHTDSDSLFCHLIDEVIEFTNDFLELFGNFDIAIFSSCKHLPILEFCMDGEMMKHWLELESTAASDKFQYILNEESVTNLQSHSNSNPLILRSGELFYVTVLRILSNKIDLLSSILAITYLNDEKLIIALSHTIRRFVAVKKCVCEKFSKTVTHTSQRDLKEAAPIDQLISNASLFINTLSFLEDTQRDDSSATDKSFRVSGGRSASPNFDSSCADDFHDTFVQLVDALVERLMIEILRVMNSPHGFIAHVKSFAASISPPQFTDDDASSFCFNSTPHLPITEDSYGMESRLSRVSDSCLPTVSLISTCLTTFDTRFSSENKSFVSSHFCCKFSMLFIEHVILPFHFSVDGAKALVEDIKNGFSVALNPNFTTEKSRSFRLLAELCILLELPRPTAYLLMDTLKNVGSNSNADNKSEEYCSLLREFDIVEMKRAMASAVLSTRLDLKNFTDDG